MLVTSIQPAIKVVKEDSFGGIDMYICAGEKIRVKDLAGKETEGILIALELGTDVEMDDIMVLELDNENYAEIHVSYIEDISEV